MTEQTPRPFKTGDPVTVIRGLWQGETAVVVNDPQPPLYSDDPGPHVRIELDRTGGQIMPLVADVQHAPVVAETPGTDTTAISDATIEAAARGIATYVELPYDGNDTDREQALACARAALEAALPTALAEHTARITAVEALHEHTFLDGYMQITTDMAAAEWARCRSCGHVPSGLWCPTMRALRGEQADSVEMPGTSSPDASAPRPEPAEPKWKRGDRVHRPAWGWTGTVGDTVPEHNRYRVHWDHLLEQTLSSGASWCTAEELRPLTPALGVSVPQATPDTPAGGR